MTGAGEIVPLPTSEWQDKPRESPSGKAEVSQKMDAALRVLVNTGCTREAAAKAVRLSRSHFSRSLSKPHVQARFQQLLRERLQAMAPRAIGTVDELMDCDSAYVRLQSAIAVLDRIGLRPIEAAQAPTEVSIHIDLS
jgi:hypothetical protein